MNPPTDEAITCVKTIQIMAVRPTRVTTAPGLTHGVTAENPMPVPSAMSARDSAAVATAPARIADHDTADTDVSFPSPLARIAVDSPILAAVLSCVAGASLWREWVIRKA
jgi:hypothetical protein